MTEHRGESEEMADQVLAAWLEQVYLIHGLPDEDGDVDGGLLDRHHSESALAPIRGAVSDDRPANSANPS